MNTFSIAFWIRIGNWFCCRGIGCRRWSTYGRRLERQIRKFRTVIFRLHGTGREEIEKETGNTWNRIVNSREKELSDIAAIVKDLTGSKNEIYVNINNHYEGSAPLTIERFRKFLHG